MGSHNQQAVVPNVEPRKLDGNGTKQRSIHPCNFRSAGRLSNEMARSLTGIQETFARYVAGALDAQLGASVKIKLLTLDRLPIEDHIKSMLPMSIIAPFSISSIPSSVIVECDIELVYPIIDLLLGGSGNSKKGAGELSEIEEEVMQDLTSLIARQVEISWSIPAMSLAQCTRVKASGLQQHCAPNDKVTVARFEMEIGGVTGWVQLVFPAAFIATQVKRISVDQPQKRARVQYFPAASIRERILDCDVVVSADLSSIGVRVKDLIKLQAGSVLQLRTPVKTPGNLNVRGREIFEALPVRNGTQKAAQLGRNLQSTHRGKE